MALYDFYCDNCKKVYEFNVPMTAEKPKVCEVCGQPIRRVWGSTPIIWGDAGFTQFGKTHNEAGERKVERKD